MPSRDERSGGTFPKGGLKPATAAPAPDESEKVSVPEATAAAVSESGKPGTDVAVEESTAKASGSIQEEVVDQTAAAAVSESGGPSTGPAKRGPGPSDDVSGETLRSGGPDPPAVETEAGAGAVEPADRATEETAASGSGDLSGLRLHPTTSLGSAAHEMTSDPGSGDRDRGVSRVMSRPTADQPPPEPTHPQQSSRTPRWLMAFGVLVLLLSAVAIIMLLSFGKTVKNNHANIQSLGQRVDKTERLLDPNSTGNVFSSVDSLTEDMATRLVQSELHQRALDLATRNSPNIWRSAIARIYNLSITRVASIDWVSRGLIRELIDTYTEKYDTSSPKREKTIGSIITEFGFAEPETVWVAPHPNPKAVVSLVAWVRPFSYDIITSCIGPSIVDPLMRVLEEDYDNLQLFYTEERSGDQSLPEEFRDFLILFIKNALRESHRIDFTAKLYADGWGDRTYFVKDEYEGWSRTKKLFFRMGEDNATKVRRILTLLQERLEKQ